MAPTIRHFDLRTEIDVRFENKYILNFFITVANNDIGTWHRRRYRSRVSRLFSCHAHCL